MTHNEPINLDFLSKEEKDDQQQLAKMMKEAEGEEEPTTLTLQIHYHGASHAYTLPPDATLKDLSMAIASDLLIEPENQKLLIAPKPGLVRPTTTTSSSSSTLLLTELLSVDSPKLKITLLGSPSRDIKTLNENTNRVITKARLRAEAMKKNATNVRQNSNNSYSNTIHTLSSSTSISYTFHRLIPLPNLPNSDRSLAYLTRLRDDAGIRATMAKHQFSIGILMEMDPTQHTTTSRDGSATSRTLGLNRNKGEAIELRLRTDAYDGYRDYKTVRRTLCHELAHCVHSEHDRAFWDLTKTIEREVEAADLMGQGGRRLTTGAEFYEPEEGGGEEVDHGGWVGGEFVLGSYDRQPHHDDHNHPGAGQIQREILARAAEERIKRQQQQQKEKRT